MVEHPATTADTLELTTVTQQAEMPDFCKALWQDVEQKPSHKLKSGKRQSFLFSAVTVILVRKGNRVAGFIISNDPAVGDTDAVGIPGKIFNDIARAVDRFFQIAEKNRLMQGIFQICGKRRVFGECVDEDAAEEFRQYFHRQQIIIAGYIDETQAVCGKAAGSDDNVKMRVELHGLTPSMQYSGETGCHAVKFRIGAELQERRGSGRKQRII